MLLFDGKCSCYLDYVYSSQVSAIFLYASCGQLVGMGGGYKVQGLDTGEQGWYPESQVWFGLGYKKHFD